MFKNILLLIIISISVNSYTQEVCKEGSFSFSQSNGTYSHNFIRNGSIYPFRNQTDEDLLFKIMATKILSDDLTNEIKGIKYLNINSSLIKTKAKLFICYESYVEQILPFLKEEVNQVTLISQKGIPFLTFIRVQE